MKQILHTLWILLAMLAGLTACTDEVMVKDGGATVLPNGDVVLQVNANIPAPRQIVTRDIDPDGLGVNNLYLFCFDQFGAYIGRREATDFAAIEDKPGYYGFTVEIPGETRVIHFLSNIYLDDINAAPGMNETTLIPSIVSASGRMAYWGRKEFADDAALTAFAEGGTVTLYRNQAQVRWQIAKDVNLQVFGYALCSRRAWGTVAPFNPEAEEGKQFDFDLVNAPYVTEPAGDYRITASDPTEVTVQGDVTLGDPHYMFENPNTLAEPVYAVMKIGTSETDAKYYKIMFVDDNKDQLPIYRNYAYVITISALPDAMGYSSFKAAKEGVAANNAWVSIDPEIPEISDGTNTLNILNGTTQIFNAGGTQTIDFTYTGNDPVSVSWLENDGSLSGAKPTFVKNGTNYTISMSLAQPGDNPVIGTLLVRAGVLTRQIKVYLMKPFEFKPVWVSTGVPMKKGENLSMTFVIPDNYPAELFPVTCKIATNKMNANNDLGVQLPIISEDCEYELYDETGESGKPVTATTNWGYKFVYTATRPGIQEVFFTLNVSEGNDPTGTVSYDGGSTPCPHAGKENHTHVFLEADGFRDEEKVVLFQGAGSERRITIDGADSDNPGFLLMELPPTINQPVEITLNFSSPTNENTVMRMATTSLKPDFEKPDNSEKPDYSGEKILYENEGSPTTNGVVNYYWIRPENNTQSLTLHFVTTTPNVDDLVRFSIDNENDFEYNQEASTWYKSAAVELRANPERFTFMNFNIVDDDSEIDHVKYGIGQPADIHFSISNDAVATTDLKVFIRTNNLKPNPDDPNAQWLEETTGGYYFTIPQNFELLTRGTLRFLTKRIASAETVTISTFDDTQALFTPASASFGNAPITGTIQLSDADAPLTTSSFIVLERKNGTRVGDFTVQSVENGIATYKLTLRPEYDFTMDEELTIYYIYYKSSSIDVATIYQATTTFNALVAHEVGAQVPLITLQKP